MLYLSLFRFQAFIVKQVVGSFSNNPFGYHTSLNDRQNEGFWTFANSASLAMDPTLMQVVFYFFLCLYLIA